MIKTSSNASHKLDSLAGTIAAFEGIQEAHTLLVGPLSCKSYVTFTADLQDPIIYPTDSSICLPNFPFGESRIPCTYVDEQDFIYGTEKKILETLKIFKKNPCALLGIVNHSGTSLIADDLNRIILDSKINFQTTIVDSTGFTGTFAQGFKNATIKILKTIAKKNLEKIPRSVNIIGPTIFHYNWINDICELKRMFELLGVKVISVICADQSLKNLENLTQAELNIVTQEEYGDEIAVFLEKELGIPYVGFNKYAPFGLSSSEAWFGAVADWFKIPHDQIDLESRRVRKKCYPVLIRASPLDKSLKGKSFGIFGDSSQVFSIMSFLHQYLGMYPGIIGLNEVGPNTLESIYNYLKVHSLDTSVLINADHYEIFDSFNEHLPDFVFGSSVEKYISRTLNSKKSYFVPISFPFHEHALLSMRPLMGFNGVLTLVEDIVNISKVLLKQGR